MIYCMYCNQEVTKLGDSFPQWRANSSTASYFYCPMSPRKTHEVEGVDG